MNRRHMFKERPKSSVYVKVSDVFLILGFKTPKNSTLAILSSLFLMTDSGVTEDND